MSPVWEQDGGYTGLPGRVWFPLLAWCFSHFTSAGTEARRGRDLLFQLFSSIPQTPHQQQSCRMTSMRNRLSLGLPPSHCLQGHQEGMVLQGPWGRKIEMREGGLFPGATRRDNSTQELEPKQQQGLGAAGGDCRNWHRGSSFHNPFWWLVGSPQQRLTAQVRTELWSTLAL